jgi:hypothetical protein
MVNQDRFGEIATPRLVGARNDGGEGAYVVFGDGPEQGRDLHEVGPGANRRVLFS